MQNRKISEGGLVGRILGKAVPGTVVGDRSIPGPGGDIPLRVYAPVRAGTSPTAVSGPRPLVVYLDGGGFVFGGGLRVMGESAGGNLSAVMRLLARDRGGPGDRHQALLLPGHRHDQPAAQHGARPTRMPRSCPRPR